MQHQHQSGDELLAARRIDMRSIGQRLSRSYKCRCGSRIFFDRLSCPACNAPLGYLADEGRVAPLDSGLEPGTWTTSGRGDLLKYCANRDTAAACNWMMLAANPA